MYFQYISKREVAQIKFFNTDECATRSSSNQVKETTTVMILEA